MMRTKKGLAFIDGGLLLLAAALVLTGYNLWDSWRAKQEAGKIAAVLESHMDSQEKVISQEILGKNAVEQIKEGGWDLTLFTCTIGGTQRITVRCERMDTPEISE